VRAGGKAQAAAAASSAQQLSSPDTTAASAAASSPVKILPSPSAHASAVLVTPAALHNHSNQVSGTHVEQDAAEGCDGIGEAAPLSDSAPNCHHLGLPALTSPSSLPSTNISAGSHPPRSDLVSSIEAKLESLSSVVVPPQFKKRALGARLQTSNKSPVAAPIIHLAAPRSFTTAASKAPAASKPAKSSSILSPKLSAAPATAAAIPDTQDHQSSLVIRSIVQLQAHARGLLTRQHLSRHAQQTSVVSKMGHAADGDIIGELPTNDSRTQPRSAVGDSASHSAESAGAYDSSTCPVFYDTDAQQAESDRPIAAAPPAPRSSRPFGLSLEKDRASAGYVVASITPFSPASAEPRLKKGAVVLELNGQACKGLSAAQVEDMLEGRGCSELRVTVKKSWLWGTSTAVLKLQEEQSGVVLDADVCVSTAAVTVPTKDYHAADSSVCGADVPVDRCTGDPNVDLDQQLRSRAAIAVVANQLAAEGDESREGDKGTGASGCDGHVGRDDPSVVAVPEPSVDAVHSVKQQRSDVEVGSTGNSSRGHGGGARSSAIMSAVEQNLAHLNDRMQQEKRSKLQQLNRRTTAARARIAVAQASVEVRNAHTQGAETPSPNDSVGCAVPIQGVLDDDMSEVVVESSIGQAMMKRLGKGSLSSLEAPAAAAVAEATMSIASRQKAAVDKERAERAALAEVIARQSALTLEARAVVAGQRQACSVHFHTVSLRRSFLFSSECTLTQCAVKRAAVNRAVMTQAREG
jgi:hypothetical protein